MSHRHHPSRRRFFERLLGASGLLALTGCDRLSQTQWFPRVLGGAEVLNDRLHHLLGGPDALAKEYTEADLSAQFPSNGTRSPLNPEYQRLRANDFRDWRLEVGGQVAHPMRLSLEDLRALPARTQITRHDCVEGWSAIAKWKGARLGALLEAVGPLPSARYLVFFCYDSLGRSGDRYYESIDLEDARHPQTLLAYEWNDQPLPERYGAPLRLRVERQLGYKMAKYLYRIEVVESFAGINGGRGGYWEDRGYAWYAGI
jgi:DMSO/TMAO reductase YedYZ molybdopterin-dependent catalytic subunit